jgi:hypothetical protein
VRTARGAGRAAGRRGAGRFADEPDFRDDVDLAAGFLAPERAVDADDPRVRVEVVGGVDCFLALGDRVLEVVDRDEPVPVLLLREPVGEDVRVAMAST